MHRLKGFVIIKKGAYAIKKFCKSPVKKMRGTILKEYPDFNVDEKVYISNIKLSTSDFSWLYEKYVNKSPSVGWNNYMEKITEVFHYEKSRVVCMPFILAIPSNYDTLYTTLLQATARTESIGQKYTYITFDQPLYIKARDILQSNEDSRLKNVILRLGGFHILMSYLGAIGHIMDGSGLKEVLSTIFAEPSTKHILSGHAYSRAVRGHILIHAALARIIFSNIKYSQQEISVLEKVRQNIGENSYFNYVKDPVYLGTVRKFNQKLKEFYTDERPTSKLWIIYFQMITLLRKCIKGDCCGDWRLHLETLKHMLPIFHAGGRNLYAKCCHVYVQDMEKLKENEHPELITKGFFTVRRTDKFWCGIPPDQTIESGLMKLFKDPSKGLTHGRDVLEV